MSKPFPKWDIPTAQSGTFSTAIDILYLVAVMDWYSWYVVAWRPSNTL